MSKKSVSMPHSCLWRSSKAWSGKQSLSTSVLESKNSQSSTSKKGIMGSQQTTLIDTRRRYFLSLVGKHKAIEVPDLVLVGVEMVLDTWVALERLLIKIVAIWGDKELSIKPCCCLHLPWVVVDVWIECVCHHHSEDLESAIVLWDDAIVFAFSS